MAARSFTPVLLSSLACFALLVTVVVISDTYESTPQLELLQGTGREEMLVGLNGKARNYETEAESAADRAYRLESERRAAKARAASLQKEEQQWLQKAQLARQKAEELRMGRGGAQSDRLQEEKQALKRRLARNEEEMQMVEHMEHQPAPWRGQSADAPAIPSASARADPKIAKLEEELQHQMSAYKVAREQAQQHDRSRSEAAEEMQLEKQIAHFRSAREHLDTKLQHRGYESVAAPRRYRSQPRIAHPRRPHSGSILGTAEQALGDSAIPASEIAKQKKASGRGKLPGVNAYSWWSNKPAKIKAQEEIHKLQHPSKSKGNCHNLYSCVGSMFGGASESKLSKVNKAWEAEKSRQKREERERGESGRELVDSAASPGSPSSDRTVSVADIRADPQQPLLGALDAASSTHDHKLPGVAENRWGGTKFWDRLLGGPKVATGKQLK